MVGNTPLLVRIQSRDGTKRVELAPGDKAKNLYEKAKTAFGYLSFAFKLHTDRQKRQEIFSDSKPVVELGLKHGDTVFLAPLEGAELVRDESVLAKIKNVEISPVEEKPGPSRGSSSNSSASSSANASFKRSRTTSQSLAVKSAVAEDAVDVRLSTQDGLIQRPRDPKMCRHSAMGRCVFCLPLEPYDENYLREHNIKHLSFHSFLRKTTAGDKGKFTPLEDISVKIKEGCASHPPWPRGICSKCQPSAVTLNRQVYRHVDNVMFENPNIVERFLSYWRASGHQRMGLLYGQYEEHADVPLGIRARVGAIYEPPQESSKDQIKFTLDDPHAPVVQEIAQALGLRCVGWIFSDLIPEDTVKGTVKHLRGIHSFFLSAQECISAAHFQTSNPNPCRLATSGFFGSKFGTVVVTGDEKNQVHMVGYQVSNQCMSLVRDKVLVPTKDAPELGYIKESTEKQYVPDVFYKQKDEYGNDITKIARPLPVEYLLVDVPVSTPIEPQFSFAVPAGKNAFPVENRFLDGQIQDFHALAAYLNQFPSSTPFLTIASDLHFLVYIATMEIYPLREYLGPLIEAIVKSNQEAADDWAASEHWQTVKSLVEASTSGGHHIDPVGLGAGASVAPSWTCLQCTYINNGASQTCEICGGGRQ